MIIIAGIRSSINLIDNMSNVLNRITGNVAKMDQTIEKTQRTMNKRTDFAENLSKEKQALELLGAKYANQVRTVERLQQEYLKSIEIKGRYHEATEKLEKKLLDAQLAEMKMADAVEKAGKKLEEQHNQMKNNIETSGNLTKRIKQLAGAYISFRGVKRLLRDTVGAAGELNQRVAVMQAAFGNADIGKHYFNRLQLYAIETRNDIDDLTNITRNFMQLTKNTDKLMGLTDIANRLSLRTRNLGSAENLIQEAIRGNFTRLQRTLHFTDAQIEPLKQAVKKGSLDGIIEAFDEALNKAGLTDEIVKAYQDSPIEKFYKAIDWIQLGFARAGENALMRLEPVLDKINTWLQSASADQFFGAIAAGVSMIVNSIVWLAETVTDNWDIIQPILVAITTVYLVQMVSQLWATIPPILAQAAAWMAAHWPIMLVAGAVLIFIKILMQAGVTAGQITGFIAGVFATLWTTLHNGVAFVWNVFATFAEFLVNLFIDPGYAIKSLFYDLAIEVLGFFNSMIQGIVSGLNWLIGKINNVLKTDIGLIQVQFMDNAIATLEENRPTSDKNVWQATRMEYKDYAAEVRGAYDWGKQLPDRFKAGLGSIENAIANFGNQEDMWNAAQNDNLGKLNDTGKKIKNSVDKTSEDLKWMRDLAEQEVINRFTTATLAPQISINFTGDIRETADIDGIIGRLEEILTEEINIAAEGVHG